MIKYVARLFRIPAAVESRVATAEARTVQRDDARGARLCIDWTHRSQLTPKIVGSLCHELHAYDPTLYSLLEPTELQVQDFRSFPSMRMGKYILTPSVTTFLDG